MKQKKVNGVAAVLYSAAVIFATTGLVLGIYFLSTYRRIFGLSTAAVVVPIVVAVVMISFSLYAFGEIVQLLEDIKNNTQANTFANKGFESVGPNNAGSVPGAGSRQTAVNNMSYVNNNNMPINIVSQENRTEPVTTANINPILPQNQVVQRSEESSSVDAADLEVLFKAGIITKEEYERLNTRKAH